MSEHDDRLRELGNQLPFDRPDAARRDAVRSALLVEATEGDRVPRTRWPLVAGAFAAGAVAAAAAVLLFVSSGPDRKQPGGSATISTSSSADFDRHVTRTPTGIDEVVRVRGGTVNVAVGAMRAGDHVRVATRNAEVEGEGSYAVAVSADELREVKVNEGRVTIRITGQQAVFLSAGQTWRANVIVADLIPAQSDPVAPAPQNATATEPAAAVSSTTTAIEPSTTKPDAALTKPDVATTKRDPTPTKLQRTKPALESTKRDPGPINADVDPAPRVPMPVVTELTPEPTPELAIEPRSPASAGSLHLGPAPSKSKPSELEKRFQAGMQLLKAGKAAEAARELGAAADAGGDEPLAADARYFQAAALTKAGRKTEAERALVTFLDRAPKSIRRGRATVMLARLIAERGDNKAARAWFESALSDPDASVIAAARAGIAALR